MVTLSSRINNMGESETLAMTRMSRELEAQGHSVINLSIGQPDFNTPDYIKQAAIEALERNFTFYPPVPGYPDLREAISRKFKRDNGLDYSPGQIVVTTGAKQAIANVVLCMINPGDEVLVPVPYWVSYREIIKLAEGKPVFIPSSIENNFKVTPEQIGKAITGRTKLMIFSSPCNPSGTVYSRQELEDMARIIARHENIYVISDEIYEHINFCGKHESIGQFDNIKDKVITINGVSKGFAMTGWRLGYLGAPLAIAKACDKLQGQFTSGACTIAQKAALRAVSGDPARSEELKTMVSAFKERRDLLLQMLEDIPGIKTNVPQGAFYVFPEISELFGKRNNGMIISTSDDFCSFMLSKYFVALVPGTAFGSPECVRISYATSRKLLIEGVVRLKNAISELT
jgi:aspartate aminotransferase